MARVKRAARRTSPPPPLPPSPPPPTPPPLPPSSEGSAPTPCVSYHGSSSSQSQEKAQEVEARRREEQEGEHNQEHEEEGEDEESDANSSAVAVKRRLTKISKERSKMAKKLKKEEADSLGNNVEMNDDQVIPAVNWKEVEGKDKQEKDHKSFLQAMITYRSAHLIYPFESRVAVRDFLNNWIGDEHLTIKDFEDQMKTFRER